MNAKILLRSVIPVVWIVVFIASSTYSFWHVGDVQKILGWTIYISHFTIDNTLVIGIMFLILHYLVFTNQADFGDFSTFTACYLIWSLFMIPFASDPVWWIRWIIVGGIFVFGLESMSPKWPNKLWMAIKSKLTKLNSNLPENNQTKNDWYK